MPSREEQSAQTREKILQKATNLFMDGGYDSVSVSQITKSAGVAKGTFFVHFPSKASIVGELGRQQLAGALDMIESGERIASWPFDRQVEHVFRTLARAVDQSAETTRMWLELARDPAVKAVMEPEEERLKRVMSELTKAGKRTDELRTDVLADRMAMYLLGIYYSSLAQWAARGGNFERWLMESVRLALNGLRA